MKKAFNKLLMRLLDKKPEPKTYLGMEENITRDGNKVKLKHG